jgi:acyl-CoA thioester hydrolase
LTDFYEIPITVEPSDIDELGHVNNVSYLRWVQDAAVAHWRAAADPIDQKSLIWVVVRHEIDYKAPAFLEDRLIARTWVGGASRRTFQRHTEILRGEDRKVVARALTYWCPIDVRTGKPTDVRPEVRERFSVTDTAPAG